jgi:predicted Fe-Mo cluster-binding NifX family protein
LPFYLAHILPIMPFEGSYMNIAIPVFGSRVSPRFDGADTFLLVRVDNGVISERTSRPMQGAQGVRRTQLLTGDDVDVLLCCGIRQCDYYSLADAGIDVYPGLMGETEEVLEAFLGGEISKDGFCGGLVPMMARRRVRGGRCANTPGPGRGIGGAGSRGERGRGRGPANDDIGRGPGRRRRKAGGARKPNRNIGNT